MTIDSFLHDACVILTQDIERLQPLADQLKDAVSWDHKNKILSSDPVVSEFLLHPSWIQQKISSSCVQHAFVIKSVIATGQAQRVLEAQHLPLESVQERLESLIDLLLTVEKSYQEIGGIVGYHLAMIKLLCRPQDRPYGDKARYLSPKMHDISHETESVKEAIYSGIQNIENIAELYPVGGAADRLKLFDPITQTALPAAALTFCGITLLERLVIDVQAKEYLFYKLYQRQVSIPIAMMTSVEKKNHDRILSLLQQSQYFHRKPSDFFIFCQPLVPTINKEGKWALEGELKPLLRPGGHGVIWKLARDSLCFDWLRRRGVKKMLVRQINNPIASEDYGLFAFSGLGFLEDKAIGFCSCPRLVKSAEGTNVLIQEDKGDKKEFTLTNIEYCDFLKYGISDEPAKLGESFSKFPSNTNLLFVDLYEIEKALEKTPIPGMLVNLKKIAFRDENGVLHEELLARLESMMQNIADCFTQQVENDSTFEDVHFKSYITYNDRRKTISTTKKEYVLGSSLIETPEGCFLDMMHNATELLKLCGFVLPESLDLTFAFSFLYHPALGPMYSIIAQKLKRGWLSHGAQLELYIAEIDIEDLKLEGSLCITAQDCMGQLDDEGILRYSSSVGRCCFKNVTVKNEGIDYSQPCVLWKGEYLRKQCCRIVIEGNGELFAQDVVLEGNYDILVKSGTRVVIKTVQGSVVFSEENLSEPSWYWQYQFDSEKNIVLTRK